MRIIAGTHRGRTLVPPHDEKTTRPITDRVKETVFNKLHSVGALDGGPVVDVFCGTGSMGLEALSRGATHCTFVDRDRDAIGRLQQNLNALHEADHATVIQGSATPPIWAGRLEDGSLSVAFVDPPFALARTAAPSVKPELPDLDELDDFNDGSAPPRTPTPNPSNPTESNAALDAPPYNVPPELPNGLHEVLIALLPKLTPGGVVVYRTDADTFAPDLPGYDGPLRKVYGAMAVHFFSRPLNEDEPDTDET